MREAGKLLPDVDWCQDAYHALEGADAVRDPDRVERVPRPRFRAGARGACAQPLIVDLRNIFDPAQVARPRLRLYVSIGRPVAAPI